VAVCPTGIDIRDGLQLECVHCTQCIDACDAVMDKVGKPRGLIRYSSQMALASEKTHFVRPRVVIYGLLLAGLVSLLTFVLITRSPFDFTVLRERGSQYTMRAGDFVENTLLLKVVNRGDEPAQFEFGLIESPELSLGLPANPVVVAPGDTATVRAQCVAPVSAFSAGRRQIVVRAADAAGAIVDREFTLLGPMRATTHTNEASHE
jgi:polyferredoxin